jgi:hypothetical protein
VINAFCLSSYLSISSGTTTFTTSCCSTHRCEEFWLVAHGALPGPTCWQHAWVMISAGVLPAGRRMLPKADTPFLDREFSCLCSACLLAAPCSSASGLVLFEGSRLLAGQCARDPSLLLFVSAFRALVEWDCWSSQPSAAPWLLRSAAMTFEYSAQLLRENV